MRRKISKKIYSCVKQTNKKYTMRNSPPYPANECTNQIKMGNDGEKYISLRSFETGKSRWMKYSEDLIKRYTEELEKIKKNRRNRIKESNKKMSKKLSKRKRSKKQTK